MKAVAEGNMFDGLRRRRENRALPWTGAAAIAAGVLFFLSNLFSEFLLPAEEDGEIVRLGLFPVYTAAFGLGALALVVALRRLKRLYRGEITRAASTGLRIAAVGALLLVLFAAAYFGSAAATDEAVEAAFFLFALGFLLLIGGSLTAGVSLVRRRTRRALGGLLLVAAGCAIGAVVTPPPVHDVALFLFAASWVGVGFAALEAEERSAA